MRSSLALFTLAVLLTPCIASAQVHVNGYGKSNGTYVAPYTRTAPDKSTANNYGTPGNYNPNKGTVTPGSPYGGASGSTYGNSYSNPYRRK